MNTKALITTLAVLGSTSSLAMARPATVQTPAASASARVSWSFGAPARVVPAASPVVRDHRWDRPAPAPVVVRPVVIRPVAQQRYYETNADRYHDRNPSWAPRYDHAAWTPSYGGYEPAQATLLADGLTYNTGEYRKDIVLEGRGRFNTLMVNEDGGCTFIKEVRIEFMGGAVQSIPVNQTLTGDRSLTFDLDGHDRAINRVFVYRGLDNVASPSDGEFNVTAM
jgi:hypothetical protein